MHDTHSINIMNESDKPDTHGKGGKYKHQEHWRDLIVQAKGRNSVVDGERDSQSGNWFAGNGLWQWEICFSAWFLI